MKGSEAGSRAMCTERWACWGYDMMLVLVTIPHRVNCRIEPVHVTWCITCYVRLKVFF